MQLLKDRILAEQGFQLHATALMYDDMEAYKSAAAERPGLTLGEFQNLVHKTRDDLLSCILIVQEAETVLISTETVLTIARKLGEWNEGVRVEPRFKSTIFQFAKPIPERLLFEPDDPLWASLEMKDDQVLGFAHTKFEGTHNMIAFFEKGAVNRSVWDEGRPMFEKRFKAATPVQKRNKVKLMGLGLVLLEYIKNSPTVQPKLVTATAYRGN